MKKLFGKADEWMRESDWKDLAFVKFCLFSMGMLCGIHVKKEARESVGLASLFVFLFTYVILMEKFVRILLRDGRD